MGNGFVEDAAWLDALRCRQTSSRPEVFVETGTYRGVTARLALAQFREVHTIELSPTLFAEISPALEDEGAQCWCGDSAIMVPHMVTMFEEPVFWYLDAHWWPESEPDVAHGELPLWAELNALAARPHTYHDVIVVDDVSCFGHGPQPAWSDVSLERIAALFPDAREVVLLGDQAAVYR